MERPIKNFLAAVWIVLLGIGLYGLYLRFSTGRELANYGSYVPWGLWVSSYIYFVGLSAGSFLLSSLVYVFGVKSLARVGRLALFTAAITLFMALISIWLDLGHMFRFYEIFTRPNFHSLMAWMVWLYSAYFLLILAELWLELREELAERAAAGGGLAWLWRLLSLGWRPPADPAAREEARAGARRSLKILGSFGVPLAIAFHGGVGALFASLSARPYWHTGLFPILFLTGALASGGALLLGVTALFARPGSEEDRKVLHLLGRIVLGLLIADLVIEWAEISIPTWYAVGEESDLYLQVLFGPYWYLFWLVHLAVGAMVPILLLGFSPGARWPSMIAGLLAATTFLAVRLNIVIPGQVTPALEGLERSYVDQRLSFAYEPSLFEWSVVCLIVALGMAVFFCGVHALRLAPSSRPENA